MNSMNGNVIKLEKVSKKYEFVNVYSSLSEYFLMGRKSKPFWALKNINLEITKGEKVGLIGPNGAGKTTLLSIISGITTPDKGFVEIRGKVISIIELEAGFHIELSGVENIFLNGMILGMSKERIRRRLKKIINFADIGKFIEQPMYSYSEGMKLRVAFSVAAHCDFDTLVLDENISVGDIDFQKKSLSKIREFFSKRKTIVIATHYLDFLQKTCERVIWLKNGRIVEDGPAEKVIKKYIEENGNI